MSRTCAFVATVLGLGLTGELALHLFEPRPGPPDETVTDRGVSADLERGREHEQ